MSSRLTLISHLLCPYVQRVSIVLEEKQLAYERIEIDLANKPDWFLNLSPLGKTPVLLVNQQTNQQAIVESAVICEYLEETTSCPLHPQDPLLRAQHRAWIEFATAILSSIGGLYSAPDAPTLSVKVADLQSKFAQLETGLTQAGHTGPYFAGASFSMVDAAFGPVFRYFDVFDRIADFGKFSHTPQVRKWRAALGQRTSVKAAVRADYPELLYEFLLRRNSELSRRMSQLENANA